MKTKLVLFTIIQLMYFEVWAGTISGTISYSGSATNQIVVAAFTDSTMDGEPSNMIMLDSAGVYTITDLNDGTYYIVSAMSADFDRMLITDPYGFYGTLEGLTPIIISGNSDITGINFTLIDGTIENPNPFANPYDNVTPDEIIQLPATTIDGTSPAIVYESTVDGDFIYLYKQDYQGAASAKIYKLNPITGEVIHTYILALESSPNRISWIDRMAFRDGILWATGGFGDPNGSGYIEGVFKIDMTTSNSSNQIPYSDLVTPTNGLACDGISFYIGVVDTFGINGVVKFNPDDVSTIPSDLFISLGDQRTREISYGDNSLWVGIDRINIFNPVNSQYLGDYDLPSSAAEVYENQRFWAYNSADNTLQVYYLSSVGIKAEKDNMNPSDFSLSQNYPNPFNPSTSIKYSIPKQSNVTIKVFDVLGREVSTLLNKEQPQGNYSIEFDASNMTSGVYFYRIQAGQFVDTKKMILLR